MTKFTARNHNFAKTCELMKLLSTVSIFTTLLVGCGNPYCERLGETDCTNRGCETECVRWKTGSNWFERHILGSIIELGGTVVFYLAVVGAFSLVGKQKGDHRKNDH